MPTLCLVAFRDGAAEAGHAETLKKGRVGGKCDLYSTFYSTFEASESTVCVLTEQDVS